MKEIVKKLSKIAKIMLKNTQKVSVCKRFVCKEKILDILGRFMYNEGIVDYYLTIIIFSF